jgi:MOSC domain-containing protein
VHVAEIWRYPVKSMAGEQLERAYVDYPGIDGDRLVHVENSRGLLITARTHPRLLGHHATLDAEGEPLVDGAPWSEPSVQNKVIAIAGDGARLVRDTDVRCFDILPLLVATDGAISAFGYDGRRLRPNIVIGGVEGLAEREWPGQVLRIGEVLIGIRDLRGRCVMTTYDPDTLEQDRGVLQTIRREFDGKLALNCFVMWPGEIRVGDAAEIQNSR